MRENRSSGSEGGVARKRHPYPYLSFVPAPGLEAPFVPPRKGARLRSRIPHLQTGWLLPSLAGA